MGGAAFGLVPIGGVAVGLLAFAAFSVGWWAMGGLAVGYHAFGGSAIGWFSAHGGVAIAHHFALGGAAFAEHANDAVARGIIRTGSLLRYVGTFMRCVTLLLVVPSTLILWHLVRIKQGLRKESIGES